MYPFKKIATKSFDKWFDALVWTSDKGVIGILTFILMILITPVWLIPTFVVWLLSGVDWVFSKFINIESNNPILIIPQLLVMITYGLPLIIIGVKAERRDRRTLPGRQAPPPPPPRYGAGVVPTVRGHHVPLTLGESKLNTQREKYNGGKPLKFTMK